MVVDPARLKLVRGLAVGGTCELTVVESDDGLRLVQKRALPGASPEVQRRLDREAQVLAQVHSPHVIRSLGHAPGRLLLELIDGVDLDRLGLQLRRRGEVLPLPAVWTIIRAVGLALSAIHEAGYLHADLGPSNVMLGLDGRVLVIDLGLARGLQEAPPKDREGTLAYQPPEQLRGQPIDVRADLYALGLIAYELLTGVLARPGGMIGAQELLEARRQRPAPPSLVRPELGRDFDEVVLWALSPQAHERPQSVAEWLERLPAGAGPKAVEEVLAKAPSSVIPAASTAVADQTVVDPPGTVTVLLAPTPASPTPTPTVRTPIQLRPPPPGVSATAVPWLLGSVAILLATLAFLAVRQRQVPVAPIVNAPPPVTPIARPAAAPPPLAPIAEAPIELAPPPPRPPPPPNKRPPPVPERPAPRVKLSGDVAVKSGDQAGPAPFTTAALSEGPTLLELSQGNLRTLVRLERKEEQLRVTVGAPPGSYYRARCGEHSGTTPLIGLVLQDGLDCRVEHEDGRSMAFVLSREK